MPLGSAHNSTPALKVRLVAQLRAQGKSEADAYAIAQAVLLKSGNVDKDGNATEKGKRRGAMTPAERAIDRASSHSKHNASDYSYNSRTNRATLTGRQK